MRLVALALVVGAAAAGGCFAGHDAPRDGAPDGERAGDAPEPAGPDARRPALDANGPLPDAHLSARCGASPPGPLSHDFSALPPWAIEFHADTVEVVANGRLQIAMAPADGSSYGGFDVFGLDLTDRRLFVEIVKPPEAGTSAQLGIIVGAGDDGFSVWIEDGVIKTRRGTAGPASTVADYDPVAQRFVGFRGLGSRTLAISVSESGVVWTDLDSIAAPTWFTSAYFDLYAGTYEREAATTTVQLEQLDDCID